MKKALSLVLVAVLAIGMSVSGFAAGLGVTGFAAGQTLADATSTPASLEDLEVVPADDGSYYISLADATTFNVDTSAATKKDFAADDVTVHVRYAEGKNAIRDVAIVNDAAGTAAIRIRFIKEYVSTGDIDFNFTVFLRFDGQGTHEDGVVVSGTLANIEYEDVWEDGDYVLTDDQIVVIPEENARDITVELGEGVELKDVRLSKNKKYYGTATTDTTAADEDIIDEFGLISCYTLKTINLAFTGEYVALTDVDAADYVYGYEDDTLVYLGQGDDLFPYYSKYFVSSYELEVDEEEEPVVEEPVEEPAADNNNFNPGTGA